MAEDYQIHFHLETQVPAFDTMLETHEILSRHGIKITADSEILLFDYLDEGDFDFEPVDDWYESGRGALLAGHPSRGLCLRKAETLFMRPSP